ncbi:hypothetical protein [Marinobacter fonticola]|uniref:hypothetical protein n=1 Tax=Marinobacter fonticola TaxID=2603215 RepID=UPI0011E87E82|nr:hypothetical protein [Marinobacter fonticola]
MSCVFLTEDFVYKLKKPLTYTFLDFSTREARLRNCETEVRINSELAPDVYQGVLTLARDDQGFNLEGRGEPLDYLVKMRRLSETCNLEYLIHNAAVVETEVDEVATKLANFYTSRDFQGYVAVDRYSEEVRAFKRELDELPVELGDALSTLVERLLAALDEAQSALAGRHRIDVHGDLRPEHVYLCEEPVFIDRLEFNAELRSMDPLEELAFFALECDRIGVTWIGRRFIQVYRECSDDPAPEALLAVYQGYRALLWAVLTARHLKRNDDRKPWREITRGYVRLGLNALAPQRAGE